MSAVKGQIYLELKTPGGTGPFISNATGSLRLVLAGTNTPAPSYTNHSGAGLSSAGLCATDALGNLIAFADLDLGPLDVQRVSDGLVIVSGYEVPALDPEITALIAATSSSLTVASLHTAAFTAISGSAFPVSTAGGAFPITLPPAVPGAHLRLVSVTPLGNPAATVLLNGTDTFLSSATLAPTEDLDLACYVTGLWSLT